MVINNAPANVRYLLTKRTTQVCGVITTPQDVIKHRAVNTCLSCSTSSCRNAFALVSWVMNTELCLHAFPCVAALLGAKLMTKVAYHAD